MEPCGIIRLLVNENCRGGATVGWIKEAFDQGELKIMENMMCPFCNPTKDPNKLTQLNAYKEHRWVSKRWFESRYDSNGNWRKRNS